jgi:beta-1,2-mannobiose phosphorylase / 1,2-beta-oligomannan phosphorylase
MKRMNAGRHAMGKHAKKFSAQFTRLGIVLKPDRRTADRDGILNPASARLRDGSLRLYPRMVAPGNVSRIGCFRIQEQKGGKLKATQIGLALEPEAPYEISHDPLGHGCEDPRVTYIAAIDRYVMAYVAFGSRGPEVAVAVSTDALAWQRVGLLSFKKQKRRAPLADKDAAFFPEPVLSPRGIPSLALYHRPTMWVLWRKERKAVANVVQLSRTKRDVIGIGYVPLGAVLKDLTKICEVTEKHVLRLPPATWGKVKVGGGTPPVRIREGWLAIIHGVDVLPKKNGELGLRYCAGIIIQSATRIGQVLYRSPQPLFVPELPSEVRGKVDHVVFPTAIDPRPDVGDRVYDIYYGMGDTAIGRGRLTLSP